jgi:cytochrome c oxidase subunit IV
MSAEHIVPVKNYLLVFAVLMVLTVLTYSVAYIDLGGFNLIVALTIAIVKASCVVLIFMHVKYSTTLTKAVVASGFFFFLIMIFFTMNDLLTRGWAGTPGR